MDSLSEYFGTPEEVAENFLAALKPETIWKHQRVRTYALFISLAIVLALVIASHVATYVNQREFMDGYWTVTVERKANDETSALAPIAWEMDISD